MGARGYGVGAPQEELLPANVSAASPSASSSFALQRHRSPSPWRAKASNSRLVTSRLHSLEAAESKSVRARAYDLLQAKKGPDFVSVYSSFSRSGDEGTPSAQPRATSPARAFSSRGGGAHRPRDPCPTRQRRRRRPQRAHIQSQPRRPRAELPLAQPILPVAAVGGAAVTRGEGRTTPPAFWSGCARPLNRAVRSTGPA
eukprot:COSAG01_NODE_2045_length_8561_cov_6.449421_8_plen_200_part_00